MDDLGLISLLLPTADYRTPAPQSYPTTRPRERTAGGRYPSVPLYDKLVLIMMRLYPGAEAGYGPEGSIGRGFGERSQG